MSQFVNITLQLLSAADVSAEYVAWLNDPVVNRCLESRFTMHTLTSIQAYVNNLKADSEFLYGIYCVHTCKHIGNIKLAINWHHLLGDIGVMIGDKRYWGKGVAHQAICLIEQIAVTTHQLKKLKAGSYATNMGSIKAFKKAGFVEEGILKSQVINADGLREDIILLGKTISTDH